MTQEEKAKAYDEALERVVNIRTGKCETTFIFTEGLFDYLFPELEECNEEEVREAMIDFFKHEREEGVVVSHYGVNIERMIAWLEKQSEQKPADKVEPKFQNGQWIVWQDKCYKVNYNGCGYELVDQNGLSTSLEYGTIDENAHLWDITKDAKDGDVLVASDGSIFIFKGTIDCACKHYVALTTDDIVKFNEGLEHYWETSTAVHPATKEQRERFFAAMHEAGYEWDSKKKELKKIEQEPIDCNEEYYNEELKSALFTSLRDAREQYLREKNAAWSEEDEKAINDIMWIIEAYRKDGFNETHIQMADNSEKWLKSLRDRYTWKPSDEQIIELRRVISGCSYDIEPLAEMEEQLKKLMEE